MSKFDQPDAGKSIFVTPVRVLKADELEQIVGARYEAQPFGRYKSSGGPDNQQKDWA